ncbi:hypothetical protein Dip518_000371 [Parelusimicrobium proximum]|uniref:hypothetical protein n=1 Tax=Parelusimicrobium proximum TaxID=3228953 RepID=UPI003D16601D
MKDNINRENTPFNDADAALIERTGEMLRGKRVSAPARVLDSVMAAAKAKQKPSFAIKFRRFAFNYGMAVALLAVALGAGGIFISQDSPLSREELFALYSDRTEEVMEYEYLADSLVDVMYLYRETGE